jgi:hypothetical protein
VSYVAQQVKVPAEEWAAYDWSGRAIKRHRTEIRGAFGFRDCTKEDQAQLTEWLAVELCVRARHELPPRPRHRGDHGARPPHRARNTDSRTGAGECGLAAILNAGYVALRHEAWWGALPTVT